jgi:hypothetical protein
MHHLLNDDDIGMDNGGGNNGNNGSATVQSNGHSNGLKVAARSGIADVTIVHVIGRTPAAIHRNSVNSAIVSGSLLIPSDVHDYLIGNGQLAQRAVCWWVYWTMSICNRLSTFWRVQTSGRKRQRQC